MKIRSFAAAVATLIAIQGNATEISTAEEFVSLITADPSGAYVLKSDIDLADSGFVTLDTFAGSIDGEGHTISGLGAKTFITLFYGTLKDIVFDGTVSDANTVYTATDHGVICDKSYGGKFTGVVIKGFTLRHKTGEGGLPIGLFAAYAYDGTEFVRCETAPGAQVDYNKKSHVYVAGFVGMVDVMTTSGIIASFVNCTNNATILAGGVYNGNFGSGGFVGITGSKGSASIPDLQFLHCVNKGNVSGGGSMNLGGFVGRMQANGNASQSFRCLMVDCVNEGAITTTGTSLTTGGLIGSVAKCGAAVLRNCRNLGTIGLSGSVSYAGGLVGANNGDDSCSSVLPQDILNCANYGAVSGKIVGGVIGYCNLASWFGRGNYVIKNCANYGALDGTTAAAAVLGQQSGGNGKTTLDVDNCWVAASPALGTCAYITTETNLHVNDTDVAGLNTVATATDGYAPWVLGATGKPELSVFSTETPATEVPVVFADWDGTVLKKEFVTKGAAATPPPDPTSATGTFLGWDKPFDNITANTFVYALYGTASRTITFDSAGGSECAPITASIGANIILPTPVREGWTFVCWSENYALRMPGTMPDYDLTLKALWLQNEMPKAERLSTLLWRVKYTDYSTSAAVAGAVFDEVSASKPDFAAIVGMYYGWRQYAPAALTEGYDCIVRGTNGDSDGRALTIAWPTNRFEIGVTNKTVSCGSDNQCMYGIFQERGTDNYFAVLTFKVSKAYVTVASHTASFKNLINNIRAQYPTVTVLVCADYSAIVNFDGYESECGGTPQGAIDYVTAQTGLTLVSGGDDLKLVMMKSPYDPIKFSVTSVDSVENETAADEKGYHTKFRLGNQAGLLLLFR